MSKKFIFVNTGGDYEETAGAYEQTDFINVSAGAGDAGKPIVLDAAGNIDASMINDADISHDSTGGAAASTVHTAFSLLDGTRDYTGIVQYDSHKTFTADTDIVDKKYVDDLVASGSEWKNSVLDRIFTPPGSPTTGDRYLIDGGTATGAWTGEDGEIAEWNGTAWEFSGTPENGWLVSVDDETDGIYLYTGSSWTKKQYEATTASLGCQKVGVDIRANLLASGGLKLNGDAIEVEPNDFAGDGLQDDGSDNLTLDLKASGGLKIDTAELAVEPNDFAGNGLVDDGSDNLAVSPDTTGGANLASVINVSANGVAVKIDDSSIGENGSNQLTVKADGINDTHIDFGTGANQVSGVDIPLEDTGGYFTTDNVEAALQELGQGAGGVTYTAGTGGVSKGDLVYCSSNDTVLPMPITAGHVALGVALTAAAAAGSVTVLRNDKVLTGILSGATAGTKYYWNGTGWQTSMPTTSGNYVWLGGVAKNATDVHVQVEFIKRNA